MGLPTEPAQIGNPHIMVWLSIGLEYVWSWLSSAKFWTGILLPVLVMLVLRFFRRYPSYSVSIGLPFGLGSRTYDTTPVDRIVAWKLYIQLTTSKAALPFEDHDLIVEVYDSLFELFGITRELLVNLSPSEFQRDEGVGPLMLRVLNDGLRPHLTRWQADFRRWWENSIKSEENRGRSLQEIQQQFPRYVELVADLRNTNTELSKFGDQLLLIARAAKSKPPSVPKVVPLPPIPEHPEENL